MHIYIYIRTDPITLPCSLARAGNDTCSYTQHYAAAYSQLGAALKEAKQTKSPILPPISDVKHLEQELHDFELHMDVYKLPCAKWTTKLQAILKGDALDAFLAVPPDVTQSRLPLWSMQDTPTKTLLASPVHHQLCPLYLSKLRFL